MVASTTAGMQFATAVPDVMMMGAGEPSYFAKPSARKAAVRSSVRTWSRSRPARSASTRAKLSGEFREPGQTTAS